MSAGGCVIPEAGGVENGRLLFIRRKNGPTGGALEVDLRGMRAQCAHLMKRRWSFREGGAQLQPF